MKERILYYVWIGLYIACVGMGTITERSTLMHIILMGLALVFFVPAVILLYGGISTGNSKMLLRVRIVSLCSLVLTLSMIVLNIMAVNAGDRIGTVLNDMLLLFSAPMFCSYWRGVSIFLWACVFVGSFPKMWSK